MQLTVENMTCGHCVRAVTQALQRLDPGAMVAVDLERGRVEAQGNFSVDAAVAALAPEGYRAAPEPADAVAPVGSCCGQCRG